MWRRLRQCSLGMRWHRSVMTDIQLVKVSLTKKKKNLLPTPEEGNPRPQPRSGTPQRHWLVAYPFIGI